MTNEELDDFARCGRQVGQYADLVPDVERLVAEVRRLRETIKAARYGNAEYSCCPWCGGGDLSRSPGREPDAPHFESCIAYTPDGTVR